MENKRLIKSILTAVDTGGILWNGGMWIFDVKNRIFGAFVAFSVVRDRPEATSDL